MRPTALLLATLVACHAEARTHADSVLAAPPPVHVDSFVPLDEALRRFRADSAPQPVARLEPAAPSADSLVRVFANAVERRDSVALRAYALSAAEFAWLYYEDSPLAKAPYELDPQMMWYQMQEQSAKGRTRVLARLGGQPLRVAGLDCAAPRAQGASAIHEHCVLRLTEDGKRVERRLFGSMIERDGRWKFVGYGNDF